MVIDRNRFSRVETQNTDIQFWDGYNGFMKLISVCFLLKKITEDDLHHNSYFVKKKTQIEEILKAKCFIGSFTFI